MTWEDRLSERVQTYLDVYGLEGLAKPGSAKIKSLRLFRKQGLSNKMCLIRVEHEGGLEEELILRVYNGDGGKVAKEFHVLRFLEDKGVPVPFAYAFADRGRTVGKPFLIMELIRETPTRDKYKLVNAAAKSLAVLHALEAGELKDVLGRRGSYLSGEFTELKALMVILTLSSLKPPVNFLRRWRLVKDLEAKPVEPRQSILHGDYALDNTIFSGGKTYMVDWENVTLGEPTFDVAYAFNLLEFEDKLAARTGKPLSEAFLEAYEAHGGTVKDFPFYRRLAALKLLVMVEAARSLSLLAILTGIFAKMRKNNEVRLFLRMVEAHMRRVLENLGDS